MRIRRWSPWASVGLLMVLTLASAAWSVATAPKDGPRQATASLLTPVAGLEPETSVPSSSTTSPEPLPPLGVSDASWSTSASYRAAPRLAAISCPSATVCFAAGTNSSQGGDILSTTDAGALWKEEILPAGSGGVTGISCPSPSLCFATDGNAVLTTTDAGTSWTARPVAPASGLLAAIACPSPTTCDAVGQNKTGDALIMGTTDGGTTWTGLTVPSMAVVTLGGGYSELTGVSCPTVTTCLALNDGAQYLDTTDGGRTWTPQPMTGAGGYGQAVACPSTTMCVTVGESGILLTTDAGSTWTAQMSFGNLYGVACPSTTECFAAGATGQNDETGGGEIVTTTDGGSSWRAQTETPWYGGLVDIACPTTSTCFAGDNDTPTYGNSAGNIIATTDAGESWRTEALPTSVGQPGAISCPSVATCYATAGNTVLLTTDGAATWRLGHLPTDGTGANDIACPSTTTCYTIGFASADANAEILSTTDSGSTWRTLTVLPTGDYPTAIACPSVTNCYAVGDDIDVTTDSGTTWTPQVAPEKNPDLSVIACPSVATCDAAGYYSDVIATGDSGATWSDDTTNLAEATEEISDIACASVTTCVVAGFNPDCQSEENSHAPCSPGIYPIVVTDDSGRTWKGERLPSDLSLTGVAWPSTTLCDAVAYDGVQDSGESGSIITTDHLGTGWNTNAVPRGTGALSAVACPSVTVCYAVGEGTGDVGALILKNGSPYVADGRRSTTRPTDTPDWHAAEILQDQQKSLRAFGETGQQPRPRLADPRPSGRPVRVL